MLKNLLWDYRYSVVLLILLFCYVTYLIITHKFKETVLGLMLQAERMAKAKILASGPAQEDWVYERLKIISPKYAALLGEGKCRILIKFLFKKAKDLLDDGKINNSVK